MGEMEEGKGREEKDKTIRGGEKKGTEGNGKGMKERAPIFRLSSRQC